MSLKRLIERLIKLGALVSVDEQARVTTSCYTDEQVRLAAQLTSLASCYLGDVQIGKKLFKNSITDDSMCALQNHAGLKELYIHSASVSSEGVNRISRMPRLESVTLRSMCSIGDPSNSLASLSNLASLSIIDCASITRLATPIRTLSELTLESSGVDNSALACLSEFTRLTKLSLAHTAITQFPGEFSSDCLREVGLSGTQVDDDGLREIEQLQSLEELVLSETPTTGKSIKWIKSLRRLRTVAFSDIDFLREELLLLRSCPELVNLYLFGCVLTNESAEALASFDSLRTLLASKSTDLEIQKSLSANLRKCSIFWV